MLRSVRERSSHVHRRMGQQELAHHSRPWWVAIARGEGASADTVTEIVGTAVKVGPKVTTVKVGDRVGVGAQISACLDCTQCKEGNETYCKKQQDTYNSFYPDGTLAMGGYSSHIRALEHFTFPIPDALESELAAPMLCAGLTAYSPLVRNGTGPGKKVGIIGM